MAIIYNNSDKINQYSVVLKILFIIAILNIFSITLCVAEQLSPLAVETSSYTRDIGTQVSIGNVGSPEKIVNINKMLIPEKDFYLPGESVRVFVEIRFLKYKADEWKLKDFTINELIDENLGLHRDSVRWTIIGNISEISKYKTNKLEKNLGESANISSTNSSFEIAMPNDIDSTKRIIYWYNITLKNTGVFNTDTIAAAGRNVNFYYADKSLQIHVIYYNFFSPIWEFIKESIWIIIVFSGIFTFYNMIVTRRRQISIDKFLRNMGRDLKKLLKIVPTALIICVSSILFFILSYSYLSSHYPMRYYPISLFIISHWDFISGIGPIVILVLITLLLLIMRISIQIPHLEQVVEWLKNMPPLVAYILALLLYTMPIILVILDSFLRGRI
jgi:hypothetical protein